MKKKILSMLLVMAMLCTLLATTSLAAGGQLTLETGEVKYMEHFGMMDNPSYYNNVLSKLDVYERNGLLIGRDIILLHESSFRPLNTRIIADYIQEFLV